MKIAIIGYGRMGHEIEKMALKKGYTITGCYDINNPATIEEVKKADVAVEFTHAGTAIHNYRLCFDAGIPVVSGTTGWTDQMDFVKKLCQENNGGFFYASNFSIGVHIFYAAAGYLAKMAIQAGDYNPSITETHHVHKLDAPSGTAKTLAARLLEIYKNANPTGKEPAPVPIRSIREGEVAGIHSLLFDSAADSIELKHEAKSREGFALGAIMAAAFMNGRKGIFGMEDLLKF